VDTGQDRWHDHHLRGNFDFHIPPEYRNEILVISMLSYQSFEAPVWSVVATTLSVELVETTQLLQEVVVSDSLAIGEILRIALDRIDDNFPKEPYLMDGFYRDTKKLGGTYISLLEAAIKIYDDDYKEPRNKFKLRERVALLEVRRSLGYSSRFTTYFDEDNLLEDLLLNNNVRYRQFPEETIFFSSLKREKNTSHNGRPVFVLTQKNGYNLKVFIDTETYAIIHLEYQREQSERWGKRRGLVGKFAGIKKQLTLRNTMGKCTSITSRSIRRSTGMIKKRMNCVRDGTSPAIIDQSDLSQYGAAHRHDGKDEKLRAAVPGPSL